MQCSAKVLVIGLCSVVLKCWWSVCAVQCSAKVLVIGLCSVVLKCWWSVCGKLSSLAGFMPAMFTAVQLWTLSFCAQETPCFRQHWRKQRQPVELDRRRDQSKAARSVNHRRRGGSMRRPNSPLEFSDSPLCGGFNGSFLRSQPSQPKRDMKPYTKLANAPFIARHAESTTESPVEDGGSVGTRPLFVLERTLSCIGKEGKEWGWHGMGVVLPLLFKVHRFAPTGGAAFHAVERMLMPAPWVTLRQ